VSIDVVTAEIIRNRMIAATLEMADALVRAAFSPLLCETRDFGVSITSARGDVWAEAPGASVFCLVAPFIIKNALTRRRPETFEEGDIFIVNDPFVSGTHISDTSVYMPVFWEGQIVAFVQSTAHWSDVGGKNPGGWCPDSTDMFQEGICFTHERLSSARGKDEGIWSVIRGNVRVPEIVIGDLEAQIACCRVGAERIRATCAKYGSAAVTGAMTQVLKSTEVAMRRMIASFPDGEFSETTRLDFDGVDRACDCTIVLNLRKRGDRIGVSFEGTAPTARGPVNLPEIAARIAVSNVIKGMLMGNDATNQGHSCIDFDFTPGLLVSPQRPAPTDSYGYAVVACSVLTLRVLAKLMPERCPAGGLQLLALGFSRSDTRFGSSFVYVEPLAGGQGALSDGDGATAPVLGNGDVPNTPVELMEHRYPFLVERLELTAEPSGAGEFSGGLGTLKDFRVLEPGIRLWFATENSHHLLATGLDGGLSGHPNRLVTALGTEHERVITERHADIGPFAVGEVVRAVSGGGGGRGDPRRRDPQRVFIDVRNGLRTVREAQEIYGVVLKRGMDGKLSLDADATARERRPPRGVEQSRPAAIQALP
jgi:N-methylhydantoinase B